MIRVSRMSGIVLGWDCGWKKFKGIGCKCLNFDFFTYPMPLVNDLVLTGLAFCRLPSSD